MNNIKHMKALRLILIIAAIAAVVLPILFVMITGIGFTAFASRTFISLSLLCVIGAIQCGPKPQDQTRLTIRISVTLALGYLLIMQWISF